MEKLDHTPLAATRADSRPSTIPAHGAHTGNAPRTAKSSRDAGSRRPLVCGWIYQTVRFARDRSGLRNRRDPASTFNTWVNLLRQCVLVCDRDHSKVRYKEC